tara:strand:- start:220 stop:420 length:201 start_codon:yes stop_codon:yes gene_type:complete
VVEGQVYQAVSHLKTNEETMVILQHFQQLHLLLVAVVVQEELVAQVHQDIQEVQVVVVDMNVQVHQ